MCNDFQQAGVQHTEEACHRPPRSQCCSTARRWRRGWRCSPTCSCPARSSTLAIMRSCLGSLLCPGRLEHSSLKDMGAEDVDGKETTFPLSGLFFFCFAIRSSIEVLWKFCLHSRGLLFAEENFKYFLLLFSLLGNIPHFWTNFSLEIKIFPSFFWTFWPTRCIIRKAEYVHKK